MDTTTVDVLDAEPPAAAEPPSDEPKKKPIKGQWKAKIAACERLREQLLREWKENVNYRKGQPFEVEPESDEITVPVDWSRTKKKQSQLYFQVPKVNVSARQPENAQFAPGYAAALNFKLQRQVGLPYAMGEALADVINAAGIAVIFVGYDATTRAVQVPAIDTKMLPPEQVEAMRQAGTLPMTTAPQTVYSCYYTKRISPAQFVWPADFKGSDWQSAEFLGYQDRIPLAEAIRRKWVDADFEGEAGDKLETVNEENDDADHKSTGKYVKYTQIFYRRNVIDPECLDPREIWNLVLVDGKKQPSVDKPLEWQKYAPETREWIGIPGFPIKVLTLTTISDEAIPPSDSKMGRPQVRELNRFRTDMTMQRRRSQPLRWFDVNRVDEDIAEQMRKGVWQDMIPMNGPGDHAIGEVARAQYPRENYESQQVIQHDLDEAWIGGPNQQNTAASNISATEANIIQTNFNTSLQYEQGLVLRFVLEIAEAVGGLMQLFQEQEEYVEVLGPNRAKVLQGWDRTKVPGTYIFDAHPDAAQRIDTAQKQQEALNRYKLLRRDPLLKPQALLADLMEAFGWDPAEYIAPPPEAPKDKPNLRFAFTGEDTTNPIVLAIILKGDPSITPEDIAAAKKLLEDVGFPPITALPKQYMSGDPNINLPPQPPAGPGMPPTGPQGGPPALAASQGATANPGHPGPAPVVSPLNIRYEKAAEGHPTE